MNGVSINEVWNAPSLLEEPTSKTRHSKYMKPITNGAMGADPMAQPSSYGGDPNLPLAYYDEDPQANEQQYQQQPYGSYDNNSYETFLDREPSNPMPPPDMNMGANPQIHQEIKYLRRAVRVLQSHIQHLKRQRQQQQQKHQRHDNHHPFHPSVWVFLLLFVLLLVILGIVLHLSTQQNKMIRVLFQHVSSNPLPAPSAPPFPSASPFAPPPPPSLGGTNPTYYSGNP